MILRHAMAVHQARGAAVAGFGRDAHFGSESFPATFAKVVMVKKKNPSRLVAYASAALCVRPITQWCRLAVETLFVVVTEGAGDAGSVNFW